ncbi:MAG TPA: hypothetical protein PKC18_04160 [Lacipirellulaceae bacterium]|nr:hypothetical protein [Lacipirellulaceae bacterium]HMP05292.1 hypothetical protein [Lacipirellulaceae bacterium]
MTVDLAVPVSYRNGYGLSRVLLGKQVFKSVTLQCEGKSVEAADERVKKRGVRAAP